MPETHYSTSTRRDYIESQTFRFRVTDKNGFSLREIAWDVKMAFGLPNQPSLATIKNDLAIIEERKNTKHITDKARALLTPERWPEWRATLFTDPRGRPS